MQMSSALLPSGRLDFKSLSREPMDEGAADWTEPAASVSGFDFAKTCGSADANSAVLVAPIV